MTSDEIEETSIFAVKNELRKYANYFKSYINDGDKEPSWDGKIYVYDGNGKEKTHIKGRIDVQIKGKLVKKLTTGNSKYKIQVADLNNYKIDRKGTLLFVVEMLDYETTKIYYRNLLPIDIETILKNVKNGQKHVSIDIKPIVDKSPSSIYYVCLNFLSHSNEQLDIKVLDVEEMKKVNKLSFKLVSDKKSYLEYIDNNEMYFYGYLNDTHQKVGFKTHVKMKEIIRTNCDIKIKDEVIYTYYDNVRDVNDEYIQLGKCIKIYKNTNKILFEKNGNIYEIIKDIKFILNAEKNNYILYNDDKFINYLTKLLIQFELVKDMFEYFGVKFLQLWNTLDEKDIDNIDFMISVYRGENKGIKAFGRYYTEIGKYTISYIVIEDKDKNLIPYNYFSDLSDKMISGKYNEEKNMFEYFISPYISLSKEELIKYSNFNGDIVSDSFNNKDIDFYAEEINIFVLNLILAYDESNRIDFLNCAEYICKMLIDIDIDNKIIYMINYLQIKKRKKCINDEDISTLLNLKNSISLEQKMFYMVQCSIAILLNNDGDKEYFYNKLSYEDKKIFDKFPIKKFW